MKRQLVIKNRLVGTRFFVDYRNASRTIRFPRSVGIMIFRRAISSVGLSRHQSLDYPLQTIHSHTNRLFSLNPILIPPHVFPTQVGNKHNVTPPCWPRASSSGRAKRDTVEGLYAWMGLYRREVDLGPCLIEGFHNDRRRYTRVSGTLEPAHHIRLYAPKRNVVCALPRRIILHHFSLDRFKHDRSNRDRFDTYAPGPLQAS